MKPLALDLFCGVGGAAVGLARAGFEVVGVDIRPQPRFPFRFVQADALNPPFRLTDFAFIWASPPCQTASIGTRRWQVRGYRYAPLSVITRTRGMLIGCGVPWCIENVPGAPIRPDIILTGPMFGLRTQRRRHFELSFFALNVDRPWRNGPRITPGFVTACGNGGNGPNRIGAFRDALGIDWTSDKRELSEAVPPAYAEFIGRRVLDGAAP